MATDRQAEPDPGSPPEKQLTKADWLRLADEALARNGEHRKQVLAAIARLDELARRV